MLLLLLQLRFVQLMPDSWIIETKSVAILRKTQPSKNPKTAPKWTAYGFGQRSMKYPASAGNQLGFVN